MATEYYGFDKPWRLAVRSGRVLRLDGTRDGDKKYELKKDDILHYEETETKTDDSDKGSRYIARPRHITLRPSIRLITRHNTIPVRVLNDPKMSWDIKMLSIEMMILLLPQAISPWVWACTNHMRDMLWNFAEYEVWKY
ncbi:Phytochrome B [Frankliniella fusca]|uniref:Phytochrome B n=1 Tax=Frankliniella fusca TaxID=407009 RepID=A0AAE1GSN3_9NEOP|nr:Phytochrome B [Frankliniella fusca]